MPRWLQPKVTLALKIRVTWLLGGFSSRALPCLFSRLGSHVANRAQPLFSCENEPTPGSLRAPPWKALYPLLCRREKWKLKIKEPPKKPKTDHTQNNKPPQKGYRKKTTQVMKFGAALSQHTHSWMEKKGMLEGCGMMAAPGPGLVGGKQALA